MLPVLLDKKVSIKLKGAGLLVAIVLTTNALTYVLMNFNRNTPYYESQTNASSALYLSDHAARFVNDLPAFERKVKRICRTLDIPAEWLMAVMFLESRFDASAVNAKGSGATGLLQWTPQEAQALGITSEKLRNTPPNEQLDYALSFLKNIKTKYKSYENLTDLYLAVFYPDALGEDYCYTLYKKGEADYDRYAPLDQNNDGRLTVKDIDDRLKTQFTTAYMTDKKETKTWWAWIGW